MHAEVPAGAKQLVIRAIVHPACATCGQSNPQGLSTCPGCGRQAAAPRDLGRIAYWHKNPLRRLAWRLGHLIPRK
jgi:hypothetical protein